MSEGDYKYQRYWWLHQLRQLRAMKRVNDLRTKGDISDARRELAKIRRKFYA